MCIPSITLPSWPARAGHTFEEVFATGQPQQFEDSRHGMDFLHSLYPVCDADGRVVRVVVYSTDVTARKLVEAALREREARYRELVQNANSAILRWRRDGTIVFFNEFAQRFFGYDADEVMGKPVSILVPEQESSGQDLTGLVEDIVAHPDRFVNNVNENLLKDGRRVWMAWTNQPILDEHGDVAEVLAVGSDITALHALQEQERLLLHTIAHDLRSPATLINGYLDLLLDTHRRTSRSRADQRGGRCVAPGAAPHEQHGQ